MMENNWKNFLKNLGEWRGSFTRVSLEGEILDSTPSILTLEGLEENQLVRFRLRRFAEGGYDGEPSQDYVQDYRSVGNQIIFFETGAFWHWFSLIVVLKTLPDKGLTENTKLKKLFPS
ncbi:MAG: DUF3598 family protein [Snowella sp.]|nr:DUF3598 family protein [Snowella sp.]